MSHGDDGVMWSPDEVGDYTTVFTMNFEANMDNDPLTWGVNLTKGRNDRFIHLDKI